MFCRFGGIYPVLKATLQSEKDELLKADCPSVSKMPKLRKENTGSAELMAAQRKSQHVWRYRLSALCLSKCPFFSATLLCAQYTQRRLQAVPSSGLEPGGQKRLGWLPLSVHLYYIQSVSLHEVWRWQKKWHEAGFLWKTYHDCWFLFLLPAVTLYWVVGGFIKSSSSISFIIRPRLRNRLEEFWKKITP